ncbi:tetratricopeptide repeat protein [Thalassospira aquimaris]|uniref:Tetratricopeptide repeat protein n=1 Tax=Thalassospira aquimaris TaxID=3037796 RepID=A0ABT6G852_9PROT|nr:tetratricopeptide repeat protein [Thalassospira sp. FZY0004]MDG4718242.1 tetratricopeptide repeat protein [Thalassospira sp. FZY0004]
MNAMSFADMGLAALKRRQFDAAINMLRQALGEDMDNLEARFGLARALHEKGSITEALGEYRTVLQSDGDNAECLYHIARALLENGDARNALNHVDIVLHSKPTNPDLLTLRAQALLELDRSESALSALQTAAHHSPGSETIHRLMAACYRANDDAEGERRAVEQLLRINPSSLTASNDMGVINLREGHLIAAFEAFEQILSQAPEHPEATLNRAIVLTVMGGMDHDAIWGRVMTVCDDLDGLEDIRALADELAKLPDDKRKDSDIANALVALAALAPNDLTDN